MTTSTFFAGVLGGGEILAIIMVIMMLAAVAVVSLLVILVTLHRQNRGKSSQPMVKVPQAASSSNG